jgi:predicted ATP-dependent endonuclease of OLD family
MQLKSFYVRVFRNIVNSGEIKVAGNTCLVGKNEAGKSACIEALHRLNPAKPVALDLLDEYPRWLKKAHEITGEIKDAVPITATFELSSEEFDELENQFGKAVLSDKVIVVKRKYEGDMTIESAISFPQFIKSFSTKHVIPSLKAKISTASFEEFVKGLSRVANEVSESGEPTLDAQSAKQVKSELEKILNGSESLTEAFDAYVRPRIPKTFYFSVYSQLRGRYDLTEVLPAVTGGSSEEEVQTAADFLKLAKIETTNVETLNFEASNAELEAISSLLTQRVKENWKQNRHLRLVVKIEAIQNKQNQMERYLQFRIEDTRHDFTSRLDRRSTGFRWFVSFMAAFFEFEKEKNIILLLDEPGLSLHARAQMDLLDSIDKNLTKGRQVIYTTHSPFMVRIEALERVRIVEDKGPEVGATVTNDAGSTSDPDTLFPLQAALGYDIAQNLFIGNRNIIVEGVSDFIYLSVISTHLGSSGRTMIPSNASLLPAGGATNIPTFIALLGGKLDLVVLLDGKAPRQKINTAIAQGRLKANRVFSVEQFCSVKGADIEDLFEPEEYLLVYNAAFGRSLKLTDIKGTDRIVKRLARTEGEFDHGKVAAHFLAHQHEIIPTLSTDTVKRFEDAIKCLVQALPPVP